MNSSMEVRNSGLQSVSIFLPRHLVHSRCRLPFQVQVAAAKQIDVDVMQQGGEPHLRVSLACVRPLRRYYAAVRLPIAVHVGLIAHRLLPPIRTEWAANGHRVSRRSEEYTSELQSPC